jgi:hypothetical protein
MNAFVELIDLESGNVIADYPDEHDAWRALRQMAMQFGLQELHGLGLMRFEDGNPSLIAMDDELVRRVEDMTATSSGRA